MAVHHIRAGGNNIEIHATRQRFKHWANPLIRTVKMRLVQRSTAHGQSGFLILLLAETADFDIHQLRQFSAEVFHMHSGPAVHVRRVLIRQQQCLHLRTFLLKIAGKKRGKFIYVK